MRTILTLSGRIGIAEAIKARTLFMAFGAGLAGWGTRTSEDVTLVDGVGQLAVPYVKDVIISKASDPDVVYAGGVDYSLNSNAGTFTRTVSGDMAEDEEVTVAYTQSAPPPLTTDTELKSEFAWKKILNKQFVVRNDESGELDLNTGRWDFTLTPTNHLYISCELLQSELSSAVIKEFAVYQDTTTVGGLPSGQLLFTPSQIASKGKLLTMSTLDTIQRIPTSRENFGYLLSL